MDLCAFQDEIGTPFCVTYDFDSETDGCVTVRFRDSMEQERVAIGDLDAYFAEKLAFYNGGFTKGKFFFYASFQLSIL